MQAVGDEKENGDISNGKLGLIEGRKYLSEESNPSIKKYKDVVEEYHKKYNADLATKPQWRQI
jgi:hypothetical protein